MTDKSSEDFSAPFLGTRWFDLSDKALFFGREDEKDHIATRLISSRPVFVHGPSGVGKSSILFAGVIPAVADQLVRYGINRAVVIVATRVWRAHDSLNHARWGVLIPGGTFPGLAPIPEASRSLEHAGRLALMAAKKEISETTLSPLLLFILDQLEDLWPRADEDLDHLDHLPRLRQSLARLVQRVKSGPDGAKAANEKTSEELDPSPGANVEIALVGGIRQDCLGLLDKLNEEVAISFDDLFGLSLLDFQAASEAIELPLLKAHCSISKESVLNLVEDLGKLSIQESLTKTQTNLESKSEPLPETSTHLAISSSSAGKKHSTILIEPLLLQIVMKRLYDQAIAFSPTTRTLDYPSTLEGAESVSEAASRYFSECIEKVDKPFHRIRDLCLSSLVSSQGRSIAKSAEEIHQDLIDWGEIAKRDDVRTVLSILADQRILRPLSSASNDGHTPTFRYELFHGLFATLARHRSELLIQSDREIARTRRRNSKLLIIAAVVVFLGVLAYSTMAIRRSESDLNVAKAKIDAATKEGAEVKRHAAKEYAESTARLKEIQREAAPYAVFQILPGYDEYTDLKDSQRKLRDPVTSVAKFDTAATDKDRSSIFRFDISAAAKAGLFSVEVVRVGRPKDASEYNCSFRLNFNSRKWPSEYGALGEYSMITWAWDSPGFLRPPVFSVNNPANSVGTDRSFVAPTCHRHAYALIHPKYSDAKTTLFKVDLCALARQSLGEGKSECRLDGK